MCITLGIDTSNYTTSAAIFNNDDKSFVSSRRLLTVGTGEIGLRQSDAVFQHTKNLPEILSGAFNERVSVDAVGVSTKPRDLENSYMPCFLAGVSAAKSASLALGVPLYEFSHQAGHIAAALFSADRLDLIGNQFISFHVSGGTTEALLVEFDKDLRLKSKIIGQSLDLKMGQAVDRIGNMLGLDFPAGKELDRLATVGEWNEPIKVSVKGCDCSVSGLENKAKALIKSGASNESVARFTIEFLNKTLEKMTHNILAEYGKLPLVFAGGVMSNSIISRNLTEKFGATFATPELSSDNAVGVAVLTALAHN